MEEFLKGFELVRSAWEYLKDKPVLKITVNIFAVSSAVFAFCSVPMVSSILGSMNETIRGLAFIVLMISGVSVCSMLTVNWIYSVAEERKAKKERESEREHIREKLCSLSPAERKILSLVESGKGCAVWVSENDAAVQTLIYKGLLKQIGESGTWEDWESGYNGRAWCILAEIPSDVREEIGKLQS